MDAVNDFVDRDMSVTEEDGFAAGFFRSVKKLVVRSADSVTVTVCNKHGAVFSIYYSVKGRVAFEIHIAMDRDDSGAYVSCELFSIFIIVSQMKYKIEVIQ